MRLTPHEDFWHFSLKFFNDALIDSSLMILQEKHQMNMNVLLYCIYYAYSGRGIIAPMQIQQLNTALEKWHTKITKALRTLRRAIKKHPCGDVALHEMIFAAELASEQTEQAIISDTVYGSLIKRRTGHQKIQDAIKNLHYYFHSRNTVLLQESLTAVKTILQKAFPNITYNDQQLDLFA